jgi:predicted RNase H-like nuclease (RuvC/YqgF family)
MKKTETERILEYLRRIDESINGPRPRARPSRKEPPLSKRVDKLDRKVGDLDRKVDGLESKVGDLDRKVDGLDKKVDTLDTRVSEVQLGLATLAATTNSQFKAVARNIAGLRVELVDHMERIHGELTGRIAGLERSGPEGRGGGGRGSGGCGVPLAS